MEAEVRIGLSLKDTSLVDVGVEHLYRSLNDDRLLKKSWIILLLLLYLLFFIRLFL